MRRRFAKPRSGRFGDALPTAYPEEVGAPRSRRSEQRMGHPWLRRTAHGVTAGILLSCLRAPLGLDWTQLVVVQGTTRAMFRAVALIALALALDPARVALG